MPIIACRFCKSRFKVPLKTIGRTLPCPRCKEPFQAVALHAAPRKSHGSGPIVYAAICVGAVLVVLLFSAISGSDPTTTETAEASSGAAETAPERSSRPTELLTPEGLLEKRARNLLDALRTGDHPLLPGWIAYERMHQARLKQGLEQQSWSQLAQEEQYGKREEYLELLMGNEATREFSLVATIESLKTVGFGSGRGKVQVVLRNALTNLTQKLTLRFAASAGSWKIYGLERELIGGVQVESARDPNATRKILSRRRNPQGEVAEVELISDTPADTTREIERALAVFKDLSSTTAANQARQDLGDIGKPAIPHLLNALVPLDLTDPGDLLVATRITAGLTNLTGQDHPIVPGTNVGSVVGEGAAENEINRRKWFGWWRDNQSTFDGPQEPDFGPEDDPPIRKKNGRRRPG